MLENQQSSQGESSRRWEGHGNGRGISMPMGADQMSDKNGLEKNCERKPYGLEFTSTGASIMGRGLAHDFHQH